MSNHEQLYSPGRSGQSTTRRFIHVHIPFSWAALAYLVLLFIAEILVTISLPFYGMLLHGVILGMLLLHSIVHTEASRSRFLLALALAPLSRLVSVMVPVNLVPTTYWYIFISIPLAVACLMVARQAHINRQMAGLVFDRLPRQLLVGLVGVVLGYITYNILRPAPIIQALRWQDTWLPALVLVICTGLLEELIFRGIIQSTALPVLAHYAVPFTAGVYAVLHLGTFSLANILFMTGSALLFGYIVKRTGSILGVTLAHGLANIVAYLVLPVLLAGPVSPVITTPQAPGAIATATALFSDAETAAVTPSSSATIAPSATLTQVKPTETPTPTDTPEPTPTATPAPTAGPTFTPAPEPSATVIEALAACSKALPSRLRVGAPAVAVSGVNLRELPGLDQPIIKPYRAGTQVEVIGGPECQLYMQNQFVWWQVKLPDGTTGWSLEGSIARNTYYLAPAP